MIYDIVSLLNVYLENYCWNEDCWRFRLSHLIINCIMHLTMKFKCEKYQFLAVEFFFFCHTFVIISTIKSSWQDLYLCFSGILVIIHLGNDIFILSKIRIGSIKDWKQKNKVYMLKKNSFTSRAFRARHFLRLFSVVFLHLFDLFIAFVAIYTQHIILTLKLLHRYINIFNYIQFVTIKLKQVKVYIASGSIQNTEWLTVSRSYLSIHIVWCFRHDAFRILKFV